MQNMIKTLFLIILMVLFLILPVSAENTYGQAASYQQLGAGSRAIGMGGAFVSIADSPDGSFYNPAGLAQLRQRQITSMHAIMKVDQRLNWVSYAHPLSKNRVVGCSWLRYGVDKIDERDDAGNLIGIFNDVENTFTGTFSFMVNKALSLGVNFNYMDHRVYGLIADTYGFDVGVLYNYNDKFRAGASLKNLGSEFEWDIPNQTRQDVPVTGILGLAWKPFDCFLITGDVRKMSGYDPTYHAGMEYWFFGNTALRVGITEGNFTFGSSFRMSGWQFDYGYEDSEISDIHRVSATMYFGE